MNLYAARDLARALMRQHGLVGYRVRVDRYGNVINCRVTRSSGFPILDGRTCRILRERVVYNPARDARGRAIAGTDEGTVRWVHPRPRDPGN